MSMHPRRMRVGVEDVGEAVVVVTETCTIVVVDLMHGPAVLVLLPRCS
jgi:hypothetical protein